MKIHKNTKLTQLQREEMYKYYHVHHIRKCNLVKRYRVSRPTIDKILHKGKNNDFSIHDSTNKRF